MSVSAITMPEVHALILTLDEEQHIGRCIKSFEGQCASVTVIDSGSKDRTVEIARSHGAQILTNPWINYATQMNFAIDALAGKTGWLLRIDADEVLDADSAETLQQAVSKAASDVDGLLVARRIHFMGRRIRHGDIEPSWQLRLWRNGRGRCEQRWMDEHIKVAGGVTRTGLVLSDINLNTLTWWTAKHNSYASREAIDILNHRHGFRPSDGISSGGASRQAKRRRFLKEHVYMSLPSGLRAVFYFLYRYVFRLGFLDGRSGWYFHLMQGLWYRTLVDAKVVEIETYAATRKVSIIDAIRACTGISLSPASEEARTVKLSNDADLPTPTIRHRGEMVAGTIER
ncbi:glycosyltransferase family 2 protein [Taklimakanibacter deserti]|uniref:glycosyltransferase family 2 protein n=1 Tax=Taklimakanibacter deserti TaxID=2267839 RepID=UPI0034D509BF